MLKVSVIVPTFNSEKFIEKTINSILNQTFKDFEIIVVDDASNDKTKEIIKKLQQKDIRIKLIELKENSGGPAVPTTKGILEAKGDYIAILESDDFYLPDFLERRILKIKKENLDWIIGGAFYVSFISNKFVKYVEGGSVSTWVFKKEIARLGEYFKKDQDVFQDLGFSIRLCKKFKNIKIGRDLTPLTACFVHHKSVTYFSKDKIKIFIKRLQFLLLDNKNLDKFWKAFIFWKIGNYYCLLGKMKKGREWFKKSYKKNQSIYPALLYFFSFFGKYFYFKIQKFLKLIKNNFIQRIKMIFIFQKYKKEYLSVLKILHE